MRPPHLTVVLALFISMGPAAAESPAPGQTVTEWQDAVTADLANRGDKMGFSVDRCALKPPFARGQDTYLARAFSGDMSTEITLVAVDRGKVTQWKEFALPGFEGWITHSTRDCKGSFLEIRFGGKLANRYRWDGQHFEAVALEAKPAKKRP